MTEDVKLAVDILRYCEESGARCGDCPSGKDAAGIPNCHSMSSIADMIENLSTELEQLKRERDAAVKDIRDLLEMCTTSKACNYCGKDRNECRECKGSAHWRGPCAENGGADRD